MHESAVVAYDGVGRLPLHHAAGGRASIAVVRALVAAYPDAAKVKDRSGQLPLHHAAGGQLSACILDLHKFPVRLLTRETHLRKVDDRNRGTKVRITVVVVDT